jgi:hypothetical protein
MIRLSRVVIAAGAAMTFAACSEIAPTAPGYAPAAAATKDVVVFSAPAPSASCTVTQNGTNYDVTVSWSGISATLVEVWGSDVNQPLAETALGHPTRKGSLSYTLTTAPVYAIVSGQQLGAKVLC